MGRKEVKTKMWSRGVLSGIIALSMILGVSMIAVVGNGEVAARYDEGGGGNGTTSSSTGSSGSSGSGVSDGGDNCVSTSVIGGGGEYCDDNGSGIAEILNIALTVLTFGVGTAAVIGMVVAGIQYATAADGNSGNLAKARSRILQIIIGLAIYAIFYGLLKFLLPGV